MGYHPLGDYGLELQRQRRLEALQIHSRVTPPTEFQRRQYQAIKRSQPRARADYKLPRFDWASLKAQGRFYGPRIG